MDSNYTKLDNSVMCFLCRIKYNEAKVLLYIIRFTVGYQRNKVVTSCSSISKWCNITRHKVNEALESLEQYDFITVTKRHSGMIIELDKLKLHSHAFRMFAEDTDTEQTCG